MKLFQTELDTEMLYDKKKVYITGYGYEPWHLRCVENPALAKEITDKGITLEEYVRAVEQDKLTVDLGTSALFSEEELKEAAIQVKCKFAAFPNCTLENLRYAGDESNTEENFARMKELDSKHAYTQVVEFLSDFHTYGEDTELFKSGTEMKDYQWWLACEADSGWQLLNWGY